MKVLILSQFYSPEPNPKAHDIATYLLKQGHEVVSITSIPQYPYGRFYEGYKLRPWILERLDGVNILRLPLFPDHSKSALRRGLSFVSFALSASILGIFFLPKKIDAIYVYHPAPTIIVPTLIISFLKRAPFVYDVNDLWPEFIESAGLTKNRFVMKIVEQLVRFNYRIAPAISVQSNGFKNNIASKGINHNKIHIIPNWVDNSVYYPVEPDLQLAEKLGMKGRFNIVFAGNIGPVQGLDVVIEAAKLLKDLDKIQFVLIGDGEEKENLAYLAKSQNLENVLFIDRQSREKMNYIYAIADVLFVHLKRDKIFETTVPSKTIAYLASGRPILMAVAGEASNLIREINAGLVCEPENPKDLAEKIKILYDMPKSERESMGKLGRETFLKDYKKDIVINKYEKLFEQLIVKNKKARQE